MPFIKYSLIQIVVLFNIGCGWVLCEKMLVNCMFDYFYFPSGGGIISCTILFPFFMWRNMQIMMGKFLS